MKNLAAIFSLVACVGIALAMPATSCAQAKKLADDTSSQFVGEYFLPAWTRNWDFDKGSFVRTWDVETDPESGGEKPSYLWINLHHEPVEDYVGFDAGVGWYVEVGTPVEELSTHNDQTQSPRINEGVYYKFIGNLLPIADGYWWMGPKTCITKQKSWETLDDNYECYLVDNSNLKPEDLVKKLGLEYVSEGEYDGSTYKHYKVELGKIHQVWSIRQEYRNEGWSSVNWIQRQWMLDGLVPGDHYNLGWKANLETARGFAEGSNCGFTSLKLPPE
ncbi:MAG: hypothetical protein AAGF31_07260 [Planctomycetota bacterium]